jgi:ElaB/YqjD/DUF883 family membrane-anchored ribosome-binding protein
MMMRGNGHSHSLPSKDLIKEINALKAQLRRVSDAVATDASDAVGAVEAKGREKIDEVVEAAQRFIDDYSESAKDAASRYAEDAKDTAGRVARKSAAMRDSAADSLVETVQNRPFGTLAAVIGIGFLAGYLCRRQN